MLAFFLFIASYSGGYLYQTATHVSEQSTTYDALGRGTQKRETASGGGSTSYGYDVNGRINQISSPNSLYNRSFGYDGAGRLTSASGSWGAGSYAYDALGNIKQSIYGSRTVDVQYNTLNQVAYVRDSAVSSNWRTYGYDTRGNVIGDGKHNFNYDYANQPVSISGNDSGSYTYDGNLKRVKEAVNGETIYSVYDKSGALLSMDNASSGKKSDYLTLSGQTFVRIANGVASYPLNDIQGTAYMVADQNGNVSASYNYTPFGEALGTSPGSSHEQGYTGHVEDKTGLTYMQARYYDPVVGRFLSTDPIGYKDQMNLYAYTGNDPINKTDPTGLYGRGDGFTDDQWKKFDKIQQAAAKAMDKTAGKLNAKADKLDAAGKAGGDALRGKASNLQSGASALRSDGSDGKMATSVDSALYGAFGGSSNGAAFVPSSDRNSMVVNSENIAWTGKGGNDTQLEWIVGHESLHTAGMGHGYFNGIPGYKMGLPEQQAAYKAITGTPEADKNPDNLMQNVFPNF